MRTIFSHGVAELPPSKVDLEAKAYEPNPEPRYDRADEFSRCGPSKRWCNCEGSQDDAARGPYPRGVAGPPDRPPRRGEGAHSAERRALPAATGAAVGGRREGLQLRGRRRGEDAARALRRALTAARLSLHVRS